MIEVIPVAGALGAEVRGFDPRDPGDDFGALYDAFLTNEVIFLRGLHLTEEEHFAFGRMFGTPSIYPVARLMGATEPKMTVIADGPDSPNAADTWHTDVTWIETPPKCALLHMDVVPERGGDTLWASATKAYETLSPSMQEFLCGLTAVHDNRGFIRRTREKVGDRAEDLIAKLEAEYPPVEHPVVRTHPETGKRALLYATNFLARIKDLTAAESDAVLALLAEHIANPALQCRWQWEEGDLAIWDERSTLHRAAGDHFPQRRVIRRLEIDGDRPYFDPAAAAARR